MAYKFHNDNGFTLIEVLVAILILTIGLLGLAGLAGTVIKGNAFSNRMTAATTLGQDKLEGIQTLGYSGATTGTVTEGYGTIPDYGYYKRTTTVAADSPASGMKTVTVTVYWAADDHSVVLKTILAE